MSNFLKRTKRASEEIDYDEAHNIKHTDYEKLNEDLVKKQMGLIGKGMKTNAPTIEEIEQALNYGRAEILSCYERLGYKGSNVLDLVTTVLDRLQLALGKNKM